MEITIINSEHRTATYFGDVLWTWGKADYPASESVSDILTELIKRDAIPSAVSTYYIGLPEEWRDGFPRSLAEAKAKFLPDAAAEASLAEKVAKAEIELGVKLEVKSESGGVKLYSEYHYPTR